MFDNIFTRTRPYIRANFKAAVVQVGILGVLILTLWWLSDTNRFFWRFIADEVPHATRFLLFVALPVFAVQMLVYLVLVGFNNVAEMSKSKVYEGADTHPELLALKDPANQIVVTSIGIVAGAALIFGGIGYVFDGATGSELRAYLLFALRANLGLLLIHSLSAIVGACLEAD